MAKSKVFVLVGLPYAGVPSLIAGLEVHRESLEQADVRVPSTSADEMFRAAVEIRREHRAWGLRRKDVEGTWVKVARRATRRIGAGETAVLGHDLLAGASRDQIALLVDALRGTAVHVVVTVTAPHPLAALVPTDLDLTDVLSRWGAAVRSPDRLHVLVDDPADATALWRRLGSLVGFEVASVVQDAPLTQPSLDTATLRLLGDAPYAVLGLEERIDLAQRWAKAAADGGYDVHGDLSALAALSGTGPTDPYRAAEQPRVDALRAALSDAVTEVGRLRERLAIMGG